MIKYWGPAFKDLKTFDVISFEQLLERYRDALMSLDPQDYVRQRLNGKVHIGISSDNLDDPEVAYYHEKFNSLDTKIPTRDQIVMRVFRPEEKFVRPEYRTEDNLHIFKGKTSNYNTRDGHVVTGLGTKSVEKLHIDPVRRGVLTGNWIYLNIPGWLVKNHLRSSINSAPLIHAVDFINEVESTFGWEDTEKVIELVKLYDSKYPNWNHDFPIKGYQQIQRDGLLNPIIWNSPWINCSEGTHRLTMAGFNGFDVPFFMPVPAVLPDKWYNQSREPQFLKDGEYFYLAIEVDRPNRKLTFNFVKQKNWAFKQNEKIDFNFMNQYKGVKKHK